MSELITGKLASTQTKIDLFDEVNFELSKQDLEEAIKLSGYTKTEKIELKKQIDDKPLSNTQRFWLGALSGVWKTMMDIDGWKLPATLDAYNICGKGYFKKCPQDNFVKKFVYHCGRIGCEICAKRAGARTAKKIERRIWLYRLYIKKLTKGRRNPYPSHIIEAIDPKDDFWTWPKQKQTEILRKIRKRVGIFGGAEINHLWAFDKSNFKPFYRPHKHLICFGWLNSNHTQIIKDEFGINLVYHKVKNGTLMNRIDVFAVAFYQLSHSAIKGNKHSVKWFGSLSYRKISNRILEKYRDEEYKKQDEEIEKSKCCGICKMRLLPAKINNKGRDWVKWLPPPEELEKGCHVKEGLFLLVDFIKKEKIPYYNENFDIFYKLNKQEGQLRKEEEYPHLYQRKTECLPITVFFS